MYKAVPALLFTAALFSSSAQTFQEHANRISRDIRARHMPYGTVLNPVFGSPDSDEILHYTRCGDSAIWTGHYLAAESFRYAATRDPDALAAARRALDGVRLLVNVTGSHDLLARCAVPADDPGAQPILSEEAHNGSYAATLGGREWRWVGRTSRDQYMGVVFGLSVAYERLDDEAARATIRDVGTRLIDRLMRDNWTVVMPNGDRSTVFWHRPEQQAAILAFGRQINPQRFGTAWSQWRPGIIGLRTGIAYDAGDLHDSYFKFNLNGITLYTLVRLADAGSERQRDYWALYEEFRGPLVAHGNAHFNVIDLALRGRDGRRDAETAALIAEWLTRPARDFWVDLRGKYAACGENQACSPIPAAERVRTDFLWQRSPFQLYGGGSGRIESAGIDFLLPYWMGRAYGLEFGAAVVSAAAPTAGVAPGAIASLYGRGLGNSVVVRDSAGTDHTATVFYSSDAQVNFLVPADLSPGMAVVLAGTAAATVELSTAAPALFTANMSGTGAAAAQAFRTQSDGTLAEIPVVSCIGTACRTVEIPIADRPVYLTLYATGLNGARDVVVRVGGRVVPVLYAGSQGQFAGLDQINVQLTRELRGMGDIDVTVTAGGLTSNIARIRID